MADENKTVAISLQLLYDPRSARAFQQMATDAAKAATNVKKSAGAATMEGMRSGAINRLTGNTEYRERQTYLADRAGIAARLGFGGASNTMGRVGSFAEGLQASGFTGAARLAQRAALPLAIAGEVGGAAQKVANLAYDRYSTNEQLGRKAFRDFVPFGERIQGFADSMSGRAAGMEEANFASQRRRALSQNRAEESAFGMSFNPAQAGREGLASAYKGQRAVTAGVYDRTSATGEMAFRDAQRLLPLKQAEAKAERDAAVAVKERAATGKELDKLTARGNDLTKERTRLEKALKDGDNQSGVSRQNLLKQYGDVNAELQTNLGQQRSGAEQLQGARGRETQAQAERKKAALRTNLQGEAEKLEDRVSIAQDAALRVGSQNVFDRQLGRTAAKLIMERGSIEGLPPDYVAAARSFSPQLVDDVVRKSYGSSSEFKQDVATFGEKYFGTANIEGDSTKAQQLRNRLTEAEFSIDAQSAEAISGAGRDFGKFTADILRQMLKAAQTEIENNIRLGRNAG